MTTYYVIKKSRGVYYATFDANCHPVDVGICWRARYQYEGPAQVTARALGKPYRVVPVTCRTVVR